MSVIDMKRMLTLASESTAISTVISTVLIADLLFMHQVLPSPFAVHIVSA